MIRWIKTMPGAGVPLITEGVVGVFHLKEHGLNQFTVLIAEKAMKAIGQKLKINHDLELPISPSTHVSMENISFANFEWGFKLLKVAGFYGSPGSAESTSDKKVELAYPLGVGTKGIKILYGN